MKLSDSPFQKKQEQQRGNIGVQSKNKTAQKKVSERQKGGEKLVSL